LRFVFWADNQTGQKRERYEHGQDCKEESEAGTQGEGEDCCEALGQRPPQDDCEALDRSQVEGSSPEGRLTADVTIDVHDRPGDLSGPRPIHFCNRPILRGAECAPISQTEAGESNARLCEMTISPGYLTKDVAKNRPFKNPKSNRNYLKMAKTVDAQPHQGPKTPYFHLKICLPYQQISADCSLS
jgi:hypothetical protein